MAAGEGRRLRPLTERWAKPVLPVDGRPVIGTLLHELRALVRDELAVDASAFVAAASAARFGAPAAAPGAARRARAELRLLRRSLRARLTAWERLRGLLSLRSLGLTT